MVKSSCSCQLLGRRQKEWTVKVPRILTDTRRADVTGELAASDSRGIDDKRRDPNKVTRTPCAVLYGEDGTESRTKP